MQDPNQKCYAWLSSAGLFQDSALSPCKRAQCLKITQKSSYVMSAQNVNKVHKDKGSSPRWDFFLVFVHTVLGFYLLSKRFQKCSATKNVDKLDSLDSYYCWLLQLSSSLQLFHPLCCYKKYRDHLALNESPFSRICDAHCTVVVFLLITLVIMIKSSRNGMQTLNICKEHT